MKTNPIVNKVETAGASVPENAVANNDLLRRSSRYYALDGLRGIAALLVVLLHVEWSNHITDNNFIRNGYLAVDLFFILSGLVISANYSTRIVDLKDAWNFTRLRFFRLYPLHICMLAAFVGLEVIKVLMWRDLGIVPKHEPFTGGDSYWALAASVFLVQGLGTVSEPGWNGPSWSISCEFFAYNLFVVAALTGLSWGRTFFIGGCITAILAYAAIALDYATLDVRLNLGVVRCIAGFFLGMLIFKFSSAMQFRSFAQFDKLEVAVSLLVIGAVCFLSGPAIALTIPLFVAVIALLQFDRGPIARLLMSRSAQFLGRISYSVYMVHSIIVVGILIVLKQLVPTFFETVTGRQFVLINPWLGDFLVFSVVTTVLLAAWVTYQVIEEPGRLFGRRLIASSGSLRPRSILSK